MEEIVIPAADAELLGFRQFTIDEIAKVFSVPVELLLPVGRG